MHLNQHSLRTAAPTVDVVWSAFKSITAQIEAVSKENGYSDVLLYTMLKDYADRKLLHILSSL